MPSNKAILRDIHDLNLDPNKAHSSIRSSGRLRRQEKTSLSPTVQSVVESDNEQERQPDKREDEGVNEAVTHVETLSKVESLVEVEQTSSLQKKSADKTNKKSVKSEKS